MQVHVPHWRYLIILSLLDVCWVVMYQYHEHDTYTRSILSPPSPYHETLGRSADLPAPQRDHAPSPSVCCCGDGRGWGPHCFGTVVVGKVFSLGFIPSRRWRDVAPLSTWNKFSPPRPCCDGTSWHRCKACGGWCVPISDSLDWVFSSAGLSQWLCPVERMARPCVSVFRHQFRATNVGQFRPCRRANEICVPRFRLAEPGAL